MARSQGAALSGIVLVGCEPGDLGGEEGRLGLSEPVAAVMEEAMDVVTALVRNFLDHGTIDSRSSLDSPRVGEATATAQSSERTHQ